jgi:hypothetical protein
MNELIKELQLQLDEDLLQYAWILQVARDCGADQENLPITEVVYNSVAKLLDDGLAEVGDTRLGDGIVEFDAWSGTLEERKLQLRRLIEHFGTDPGLGEGFWLAKRQ